MTKVMVVFLTKTAMVLNNFRKQLSKPKTVVVCITFKDEKYITANKKTSCTQIAGEKITFL